MYPQRTVYPFRPGFLPIPQRPQGAGIQTGYTATGPAPQQPGAQSGLLGLAAPVGSLALSKAFAAKPGMTDSEYFDYSLKNGFDLNPQTGITDLDRAQFAETIGGTYPGYYAGPEGAAASVEALDAESPYAASNLLANGADPEIMAQLAAEGSTTADLGLTGAAGAGAASGAAGAGAASGAAAGGAAAEGAAAGAEGAGLLGMGALGPIALGGLGIYGLGSLLDWW